MNEYQDLVAFWSARLDEDEAAAKAAGKKRRAPWRVIGTSRVASASTNPDIVVADTDGLKGELADHIALHDPARTLREVEADRKLLAKLRQVEELGERLRVDTEILILRQVIAIRAAIWSDHPDYEGWLQ